MSRGPKRFEVRSELNRWIVFDRELQLPVKQHGMTHYHDREGAESDCRAFNKGWKPLGGWDYERC